MDKSEVIKKLKALKPRLEKEYGLTTLALFGSYSRDEQTTESDIDLLIDFGAVNANHFYNYR